VIPGTVIPGTVIPEMVNLAANFLDGLGGGMFWILDASQALETTVREFRWLRLPPAWVVFLVVVPLVLGFAAFFYRREKASGGKVARYLLMGLRSAIVLGVLAMLAEPVLRTTQFQNQHSTVLLLLDDSLSMDIADKYSDRDLLGSIAEFFESGPETVESTRRYDLVRRLFQSEDIALLDKLRAKGNVVVYSLAGGLQRLGEFGKKDDGETIDVQERDVLPPYEVVRGQERVRQTRLSDGILEAVASVRGGSFGATSAPISAVVLLTDGQQTAGSQAPVDVARRLGQRNIPLFTVGVGNPDPSKDVRVTRLECNEVVLAEDRVPFDAAIVADGFEGSRVRVELLFDGAVVDTEYVVLEGGGRQQTVRLEHRPPESGDFLVTVEVEHQSGELFAENNSASKSIRVLEQKIRVLYLEGPPRWEYRYLKNALTHDPTMETQVVLLSADKEFVQESSGDLPPLVEVPRTRAELLPTMSS